MSWSTVSHPDRSASVISAAVVRAKNPGSDNDQMAAFSTASQSAGSLEVISTPTPHSHDPTITTTTGTPTPRYPAMSCPLMATTITVSANARTRGLQDSNSVGIGIDAEKAQNPERLQCNMTAATGVKVDVDVNGDLGVDVDDGVHVYARAAKTIPQVFCEVAETRGSPNGTGVGDSVVVRRNGEEGNVIIRREGDGSMWDKGEERGSTYRKGIPLPGQGETTEDVFYHSCLLSKILELKTDFGTDQEQEQTQIQTNLQQQPSYQSSQLHDIDQLSSSSVPSSTEPFPSTAQYWHLDKMAPLNPRSLNAISRLQRYLAPNFPLWHTLPACRRAGVLILLYPDQVGDLRVVLTMRAAGLRNFSGHAAFPGGKADDTEETPYQIARREAWEEIGLPQHNHLLPKGYDIKQVCYLPHALARTDVVVRPCVAILDRITPTSCPSAPAVADAMRPTPQVGEVAAVFSAPLHNFLCTTDETPNDGSSLPDGPFYDGFWADYDGQPWRVHNFYVPITNQKVTKPAPQPFASFNPALEHEKRLAENADVLEEHPGRYKVWGMTAKILVEAAGLAYAERPEMEVNEEFGDEELAIRAAQQGRFFDRKRRKHGGKTEKEAPKKNIAHILSGWRQGSEERVKM